MNLPAWPRRLPPRWRRRWGAPLADGADARPERPRARRRSRMSSASATTPRAIAWTPAATSSRRRRAGVFGDATERGGAGGLADRRRLFGGQLRRLCHDCSSPHDDCDLHRCRCLPGQERDLPAWPSAMASRSMSFQHLLPGVPARSASSSWWCVSDSFDAADNRIAERAGPGGHRRHRGHPACRSAASRRGAAADRQRRRALHHRLRSAWRWPAAI